MRFLAPTQATGKSLLHIAIESGSSSLVSAILGFGACTRAADHRGETPLMAAIRCNRVDLIQMIRDEELGGQLKPPSTCRVRGRRYHGLPWRRRLPAFFASVNEKYNRLPLVRCAMWLNEGYLKKKSRASTRTSTRGMATASTKKYIKDFPDGSFSKFELRSESYSE